MKQNCKKQYVDKHNNVKLIKIIKIELIIKSLTKINILNNCLFYICFENIRFESKFIFKYFFNNTNCYETILIIYVIRCCNKSLYYF